jgi:hypothetical protein
VVGPGRGRGVGAEAGPEQSGGVEGVEVVGVACGKERERAREKED